MKKTTRLTLIALLAMLVLVCGTVLVACGGNAEEAINAYMLNKDLVEDDFVLPKYIGELNKKGVGTVKVNWTSDNDAIEIVERDEDFLAKVNQKDTTTTVNLTISAKKHEKSFKLIVSRFDVYSLSGNYVFVNKGLTVSDDFELDTTHTYKGHTATISWKVEGKSANYLKVVEKDGKTICEVDVPGTDTDVEIIATFKYNGKENAVTYSFKVGEEKSHLNYVDTIYSVSGTGLSFSGYVVAIHEVSTEKGNATFYAIDDDFCSGYYFYRIKMSETDLAKFELGVHVTITGDTAKDYNGLWENNGGGTAVIDENPEDVDATIKPRDHVYALDNDIIAGSPATLYRESTLVSLTGWEITRKYTSAPKAGSTSTLFYVKKADSAEVAITISKYLEGHYKTAAGDATWEALCAYYTSFEVGDVINVTGVLGYYNGFQIQPLAASDIVKTTADAEGTTYLGTAVKSALKAVSDAITSANIGGTLSESKTFTLPTSSNGVNISYQICGTSKSVKIENETNGAKFTVTPGKADARKIQVTYTNGTYVTYSFFKITSEARGDQDTVDAVKANLDNELQKDFHVDKSVELPTSLEGTTITWAITEGSGAWVKLEGNKLTVLLDNEAHTVKLTATIKLGSITDTKDIDINLYVAVFHSISAPTTEGEYVLHMYQENDKTHLYATGAMSGFYFATDSDTTKAAKFTIEKAPNGADDEYVIKVSVDGATKFVEIIPRTDGSTGVNVKYNDSQTEGKVWKWNDSIKTFTCMSTNNSADPAVEYFLGTSGTFKTFSASAVKYASTSYVGQWGTLVS